MKSNHEKRHTCYLCQKTIKPKELIQLPDQKQKAHLACYITMEQAKERQMKHQIELE